MHCYSIAKFAKEWIILCCWWYGFSIIKNFTEVHFFRKLSHKWKREMSQKGRNFSNNVIFATFGVYLSPFSIRQKSSLTPNGAFEIENGFRSEIICDENACKQHESSHKISVTLLETGSTLACEILVILSFFNKTPLSFPRVSRKQIQQGPPRNLRRWVVASV